MINMEDPIIARSTAHIYRLLGSVVGLFGLVADCSVGLAVLHGTTPLILLLHLPAVLIWCEGMCTINGGSLWQDVGGAVTHLQQKRVLVDGMDVTETPVGNARVLIMGLLSLILFPGFGAIGCTLGGGLSALPFMIRRQRPVPTVEMNNHAAAIILNEQSNPLLDLTIQPLIDVVQTSDTRQKRAAIRLLGQQFDHEAVHLLRGLLTDADPDVRSEASVTLFRFEDVVTRSVNEAQVRVQAAPTPETYAHLGETYCRAVQIGLLDEPSALHYLAQASDAYTHAIARAPEVTAYWIALAQIERDRGDSTAALAALDGALTHEPESNTAIILRMEIAFMARRWDVLAVTSLSGNRDDASSCTADTLLKWWSGETNNEPTATQLIEENA